MAPSSDRTRAARGDAARLALDILGGSRELFAGLLELVDRLPELEVDGEDEDLGHLLDVAAELEDLPVGPQRNVWPRRLLAEADLEIAQLRRLHRDPLLATLRRIAQRFAADRRPGP